MKKHIIFFISLLTLSLNAQQITFMKTYPIGDGAEGKCVRQLTDGTYIIAGHVYSANPLQSDAILIKTNIYGDTTWTKRYGGNAEYEDEEAASVQIFDNGYIFTGTDWINSSDFGLYNVKTNATGDMLWEHTHSYTLNMDGSDIALISGGGFATVGYYGFSGNYARIWLSCFDNAGDSLWMREYNYFPNMYAHSIKTSDMSHGSGFIIGGEVEESTDYDAYLLKTDNSGDTTWTARYGGAFDERGYCVEQTFDGGYILAGSQANASGDYNVFCVKTNGTGNVQWEKSYGLPNKDERGRHIIQTPDNNFVIVGYRYTSSTNDDDILLMKINLLGDTLWTKIIGEEGYERAYWVANTSDGGLVITGSKEVDDDLVAFLLKTDANGNYSSADTPENSTFSTDVSIYPNPVSSVATLSVQNSFPVFTTECLIFDLLGRQVKHLSSQSSEIQINTNDLCKGLYGVEVIVNGLYYTTTKLIVR